ncbi:Hypothetical Protein FCC1311_064252 [Hondaea fermentalgiana]|uniref:Uncharacterized protein n=1 Tax=Hondaea fermentalgiana TaxID=2315210 RepID=A0A2R5GHY6_9STRA|nr:Hypothetical Protein FCC1311_064252 [Hondaea fermentalgiana]|eukprot:GBG30205.1 Hypothetical Protein FCC1311_064252 [Hondaea fermentalgiana]
MPAKGGRRSDAPLSLEDLELEFERTLQRLGASEGQVHNDDESRSRGHRDARLKCQPSEKAQATQPNDRKGQNRERREAMQEFLALQKTQEKALRDELAASEALDEELTQEALMTELRGIQMEMDEYSRLRSARRRLARSLPPAPRPKPPQNELAMQESARASPHRKSKRLAESARHESVTQQMDVAMRRALELSREHELEQREASIMEGMFERENANLEMILRTHYERTGMKHLEALGRELSERRRNELAHLRSCLEDENEGLLQEMRQEFEARLSKEKASVEHEYEEKRKSLKEELQKEFSEAALEQEIENYKVQVEHRIGEEIAKARREEEARQRELLGKACADKLAEKEAELARAREAVRAEYTQRRERTLRDLESALGEGARESQLALVSQLEREIEADVQARHAFWDDKRSATLGQLRAEQDASRSARLDAIDAEASEALESAMCEVREAGQEALEQEVRARTLAAQERQEAVLKQAREELEADHARALADLAATHKRDLEAAEASKRSDALSELQAFLESERQRLQNEMEERLDAVEKRYANMLEEGRAAFASFRNQALNSGKTAATAAAAAAAGNLTADTKDLVDGYSDDFDEADEEEDKTDGPNKIQWKLPSHVRPDEASERMVLKFLQNAAEGHHELSERLRQANRKVSKLGKELVQMRQTKATDLSETKRQLHEARQTIQKLFQANRNLSQAKVLHHDS